MMDWFSNCKASRVATSVSLPQTCSPEVTVFMTCDVMSYLGVEVATQTTKQSCSPVDLFSRDVKDGMVTEEACQCTVSDILVPDACQYHGLITRFRNVFLFFYFVVGRLRSSVSQTHVFRGQIYFSTAVLHMMTYFPRSETETGKVKKDGRRVEAKRKLCARSERHLGAGVGQNLFEGAQVMPRWAFC
jgi:hypothetical protein